MSLIAALEKNKNNTLPNTLNSLIIGVFLYALLAFASSPILAQDCFYNACTVGPICDLGPQYYSPGDFILDESIDFNVYEEKIIPQPYYEEYKDFVCKADECDSSYGDTWYCTSAIPGGQNINRIQRCPNFAPELPNCRLWDCKTQQNLWTTPYCDVGAVRTCDVGNMSGWYECAADGVWSPIFDRTPTEEGGECRADPPRGEGPWMYCIGGQLGVPGSGRWENSPFEFEQGRCEDMQAEITAAMTPGYVKTYTPYLFNVWQNTVKKTQAIFTPFRTQIDKEIYDWPGEINRYL